MRPLALVSVLFVAACTTEEAGTPIQNDPVLYEEDDEDGNGEPFDAEEVPDAWTTELQISGHLEDCRWDNNAEPDEWSWTGDNDSYEVEVPDDGFIDAELHWDDEDTDADFIVYINPSGSVWSPDHYATGVGASEVWVPDEEFSRGDDLVITVACPQGPATDYVLTLRWER